jgi:hypothetical protein
MRNLSHLSASAADHNNRPAAAAAVETPEGSL